MENQRHLEVILEDMNSKFDLLIESHQTLQQQIHDTKAELKEDIGLCNFKIDTLNQKIDGVAADLKSTDERMSKKIDGVEDKLTKKIDGVEAKLNNKIDGVESKLSQKIDGVEAKLSQKIDNVAADLKAHRDDTELHHGVYKVKE